MSLFAAFGVRYCYAECRYAECHYVQCHYAECRSAMRIAVGNTLAYLDMAKNLAVNCFIVLGPGAHVITNFCP